MQDIEKLLVERIEDVKKTEVVLAKTEKELMDNPQFKQFLELQKSVNDKAAEMWEYVEQQMLENNIKSIKGEFGSVTIAERQGWTYDEETLPKKFFKKVIDTKKVTDTYRLEGKAPKGCAPYTTRYLTKRLK